MNLEKLAVCDHEIAAAIGEELGRQRNKIELIASEKAESVVVKIFESEKVYESHQLAAGTIVTDGKKFMKVAVPDGFVSILSLQLPGKKRLKTDELLRGYRLEDGCKMK